MFNLDSPARCQVLDNQPDYLFHGTSVKYKKSILNIGMPSTSYWGTQEVAEYFAQNTPGRPLIFRVPITEFCEGQLDVDSNMVDFPIFDDYDVRALQWEEREEQKELLTWRDSLEIYEAVLYRTSFKPSKEHIL